MRVGDRSTTIRIIKPRSIEEKGPTPPTLVVARAQLRDQAEAKRGSHVSSSLSRKQQGLTGPLSRAPLCV
jgi:hypothetical protein